MPSLLGSELINRLVLTGTNPSDLIGILIAPCINPSKSKSQSPVNAPMHKECTKALVPNKFWNTEVWPYLFTTLFCTVFIELDIAFINPPTPLAMPASALSPAPSKLENLLVKQLNASYTKSQIYTVSTLLH